MKIDTSTIEGYSEMTAEEKLAVLEGFEYEDNSKELEKLKNAVTRANSEVSEWKKKHNALLSEEEKRAQAKEEEFASIKQELETLKKEKLIGDVKAQFVALGYDEELANATALAQVEGDVATVMANGKKFLEAHDKSIKAELMKGTPAPPAGDGGQVMTLQKLRAMDQKDRIAYANEHPEEYATLYSQE